MRTDKELKDIEKCCTLLLGLLENSSETKCEVQGIDDIELKFLREEHHALGVLCNNNGILYCLNDSSGIYFTLKTAVGQFSSRSLVDVVKQMGDRLEEISKTAIKQTIATNGDTLEVD